jgi:hypothetical protein
MLPARYPGVLVCPDQRPIHCIEGHPKGDPPSHMRIGPDYYLTTT